MTEQNCCPCTRCSAPIKGEFFRSITGSCFCKKCLKDMFVYHALRSLGMIQNTEEDLRNAV